MKVGEYRFFGCTGLRWMASCRWALGTEHKRRTYAMSEENKALVRRYFEEIWDVGNLDLIDELFTTNFVRHGPSGTEGEVRGLEDFKGLVTMYRTAFPDLQVPIED